MIRYDFNWLIAWYIYKLYDIYIYKWSVYKIDLDSIDIKKKDRLVWEIKVIKILW